MLMLYAVDRGTCHARRGLFVLLKTVLARECGRSDSSLNRDRYTLKRYIINPLFRSMGIHLVTVGTTTVPFFPVNKIAWELSIIV